jgi:hypothetical protein
MAELPPPIGTKMSFTSAAMWALPFSNWGNFLAVEPLYCKKIPWPPLWSNGQSSWLQKGYVLCFLWGTNWIYLCYVEESSPPLMSSGQSSWLKIQRSGFDSRRYQIFWEVVGLERGPLSLVNTIEELLERKSSGCGLKSREYGLRDPSLRPLGTLYPQKLALTSPRISGCSVGIVRSWTQVMERALMKKVSLVWGMQKPDFDLQAVLDCSNDWSSGRH